VWAIVPAQDAKAFAERWQGAYQRAVPGVTSAAWFTARPAPAAIEVDFSES
jgi:hypothetical protein